MQAILLVVLIVCMWEELGRVRTALILAAVVSCCMTIVLVVHCVKLYSTEAAM